MSELAPEQATPEAAEPEAAPEAPAEETWSGPSQEEWQETQEALQYFASLAQPQSPFQQQQEEPETVEFDPLADDAGQQLRQVIQKELEPYREFVWAQQVREGNARAQDIIADEVAKNGDFLHADTSARIQRLATAYIGQTNEQFVGDERRAAEAAYELAIKDAREWEAKVKEAAIEQYKNELAGLSGARRELGAGGINGQQFNMPTGGSLVDVAYRHGGGR